MDCSPPGSSVYEISQAIILEWVAILSSRGSFWPKYWTQVSCIAGRFFTIWATVEAWVTVYGATKESDMKQSKQQPGRKDSQIINPLRD